VRADDFVVFAELVPLVVVEGNELRTADDNGGVRRGVVFSLLRRLLLAVGFCVSGRAPTFLTAWVGFVTIPHSAAMACAVKAKSPVTYERISIGIF
jgi:hypothetical protein